MKTEGIMMLNRITIAPLITSSFAQIWDQKKGKVGSVQVIFGIRRFSNLFHLHIHSLNIR